MNVPRGNVLLKPTLLSVKDFRLKLANLKQYGFTGYMKLEKSVGFVYYVFLLSGILGGVVEFVGTKYALISDLLLFHKVKTPCKVASYVLGPEIAEVLSNIYAFQEKQLNYQVRKKEFLKVLGNLESEQTTGFIEIAGVSEDDSVCLALHHGKIVTDSLLDAYGQFIAGPKRVAETVDSITANGGLISTYGEKSEEIERRRSESEKELSLYKELTLGVESGALRLGGSVIKVDDGLLLEWSNRGTVQKVEIFTGDDHTEAYKVAGKKGLANRVIVVSSIQKKLGLVKDEPVLVKPIY